MNDNRSPNPNPLRPAAKKKSLAFSIGVVVLLAGYVLLRPTLKHKFGIQLPGLGNNDATAVQDGDSPAATPKQTADVKRPTAAGAQDGNASAADRDNAKQASSTATYLRNVGGRVQQSPAGLQYRPGSFEGHRTAHVLRHANDDPDRDIHGVFEGDADRIFAVIDEAYELAKQGGSYVKKQRDKDRTIYTVDLDAGLDT